MTVNLLPILGLVWFVAELCLTRRSGPGAISQDRGSLGVLWRVEMISIGCGIVAAFRFPAGAMPAHHLVYLFGICVLVLGLVLRVYSILYLGRFFTINVAIAADHRLIDSGPYRFVRHPSYTGALMLFLGLGLGIGNWLSVALIIIPVFLALRWRMQIEEAALSEALGETYRRYMQRTKRLLPMIY
jgi:protein-S-isoprenylcysteine O-methyltransferase